MQRRYETTTLKPLEEKKILADIKRMKEGIPNAQRILDLKPKIDALYDQRTQVNEQLNKLRPLIEAKHAEIDKISKELDDAKEQREDIKSQLDKFEEDIAKVKEEIGNLVQKKQEIKEVYYQSKYDYEIENEAVRYSDWLQKQKTYILEQDKRKQERLNARKQALADRPNPYQKELDTCERLIQYCELLKKKVGLGPQTDETIKEEAKQIMNQLAKEDVQKKLQDRKIELVMSKREREEAAMIKVGGKKGKGGGNRRQKQEDNEEEEVFTSIDISILNLFGFLKVSPPLEKDALEPKIKELNDKLTFYIEDGDKKLKEEAEKLLAGEFVEEEVPEETKGGADDHRRGGTYRGGRGRGGRGGNFRAGGGDRKPRRDDDDDVYVSSGDEDQRVSKLAKRPSNKKENLALDDNNYPTL